MNTESMYTALGITSAVHRFGEEVLAGLRARFDEIDRVAEYNQCKVIGAMQKNRVDATHFAATTGYGYNDAGRAQPFFAKNPANRRMDGFCAGRG